MHESVKIIVVDNGDASVGIFPVSWQVECPFSKQNIDNGDIEKETLEWFRDKIINAYKEFAEGRCHANYDFEYVD
jgi:hypothetical protein